MLALYDPIYYIIMLPGLIAAAWAQMKVTSAFAEGSRYLASSGLTGAEASQAVLRAGGVSGVAIEPVGGSLSDHYDPVNKVLRLSRQVYGGRTLSAVGVAAHEAGHGIQDARRYLGLVVRNLMVPVASFGSNAAWLIILAGLLLTWSKLVLFGIACFAGVVAFQIVNLPVEFDASRRARQMLLETGIVTPEEDVVVGRVLNAAALTCVAATLSSVLSLLYYLVLLGGLNRRGRDSD